MTSQQNLTGTGFAELIRSGHARLQQMVGVVNALNVFPVPDGDTGTNMEMSLASGVAQLENSSDKKLCDITQAFASGLLMGARGNSGVILSQLFRGFAKVTQNLTEMDVLVFAKALHEGVQIAYRAVAKPVEGTILTVAREAAAAGLREAKKHPDFAEWMHHVHAAAARALAHTPEQLPVLKQAGVVDSGGQGLVFIFEGFYQWLKGEPYSIERMETVDSALKLDFAGAHIDHHGEFGYCTEALIRIESGNSEDAQASLQSTLSQYGDSLLVVGTDELVKVHVHTLHPGRVLEDALAFGPLVKIKIDNMTEQHAHLPEARSEHVEDVAQSAPVRRKPLATVAVAAGDGLSEIFSSLGVDVVLSGGQTLNPSTEEIVSAIRSAHSDHVIVLPNNKNIVLAAQQAKEVLGSTVHVVPTTTVPEGIAAMMAFHGDASVDQNVARMTEAIELVHSGLVVRAVRDSVFQDRQIRANQYLGFDRQQLVYVGDSRDEAVMDVVREMGSADAELLTVFYGHDVPEDELHRLVTQIERQFDLEVELKYGGQPVYDYILSLE
jgi:uncharacterized protein